SRWNPWLTELQPELFVELSPELAAERGIKNLDFVRVSTPRGSVRAKALVTRRMRPLTVDGRTIHQVGMPWHWGYEGLSKGDIVDNTRRLDGIHWRHVKFIEQFTPDRGDGRWLLMSDVCKHCVRAGCLEVCPTGAIIRTEFDTVVIQSDVCNGCRDCIGACPFGVIDINPVSGTAQKCTLCYDRMRAGMTPACAQACPTASINFGPVRELKQKAQARVEQLHGRGERGAYLYGADEKMLGGLNSFYL